MCFFFATAVSPSLSNLGLRESHHAKCWQRGYRSPPRLQSSLLSDIGLVANHYYLSAAKAQTCSIGAADGYTAMAGIASKVTAKICPRAFVFSINI
jgi:hypothetical protein